MPINLNHLACQLHGVAWMPATWLDSSVAVSHNLRENGSFGDTKIPAHTLKRTSALYDIIVTCGTRSNVFGGRRSRYRTVYGNCTVSATCYGMYYRYRVLESHLRNSEHDDVVDINSASNQIISQRIWDGNCVCHSYSQFSSRLSLSKSRLWAVNCELLRRLKSLTGSCKLHHLFQDF